MVQDGSLAALVAWLPFPRNDMEAAARAYAAWREAPTEAALHTVQVWTYVYVAEYFVAKLTRERAGANDLDMLTGEVFAAATRHIGSVRDPARYPAWVSVICKNRFRAYLARRPASTVALPDDDDLFDAPDEASAVSDLDPHYARMVLRRALDALPAYLRPCAERRLMDGADYAAIADETGHSVLLVRTYVHKALARMRTDPAVRALHYG